MVSKNNTYQRLKEIQAVIMPWIQRIIFSDIYISFGAVCFAYANMLLMGVRMKNFPSLLILIGAATMFIYQFSRWIAFKNSLGSLSQDLLFQWMRKNQSIVLFLLAFSAFVVLAMAFFIRIEVLSVLCILGLISFLYNLKIRVRNKIITLRKIPFAKIFMISLVWSVMAVLLPWTNIYGWQFETKMCMLLCIQFLFIFIITLPFDMNDLEADKEMGIYTIPMVIGDKASKELLAALSCLYLLLLYGWILQFNEFLPEYKIFMIGIVALVFALLYKTIIRSRRADKWQIMLWYDGSLILYALIAAFAHFIPEMI